jgi:predicted  nucleic acid-binding Zn-ribbon protein
MSVTESLLRVFRVDQQLRGLTGRLTGAEKFLEQQTKLLDQLNSKRAALHTHMKQVQVQASEHEGEMKRIDARVDTLKEQMNNAQTNKEYKALLTEVNTYKADRSTSETAALEMMTKIDEMKKQIEEIDAQIVEREKVKKVAEGDRAAKNAEIADRLNQLKSERETLISQVPPKIVAIYAELVRSKGDEAMAPVEELDARRHEYTCGSCQMTVPVERVATLMTSSASAEIIRCASCGCVLYIESATAERFNNPTSKGSKGGKGKGKKTEQEV